MIIQPFSLHFFCAILINTNTGLTSIRTHEKILRRQRNWNHLLCHKSSLVKQLAVKMNDSLSKVFLWWWTWPGSLLVSTTRAQNLIPQPLPPSPSSSSPGPGSKSSLKVLCMCVLFEKLLDQPFFYQLVSVKYELTPVEALCDMAGASVAEAAANMERGSVPSSMELRGSNGAEEEEEEDEDVLPFRAPRRVFVSVTWVERRVRSGRLRGVKTTYKMQKTMELGFPCWLYITVWMQTLRLRLPWWVWGDGSLQTQPEKPQDDISAAPLHSFAHGNALWHKRQARPGSALFL